MRGGNRPDPSQGSRVPGVAGSRVKGPGAPRHTTVTFGFGARFRLDRLEVNKALTVYPLVGARRGG